MNSFLYLTFLTVSVFLLVLTIPPKPCHGATSSFTATITLYVSLSGSDMNNGTSPEFPLQSVDYAINLCGNNSTNTTLCSVQFSEGVFNSTNSVGFELVTPFALIGSGSNTVILNLDLTVRSSSLEVHNLTLVKSSCYASLSTIVFKNVVNVDSGDRALSFSSTTTATLDSTQFYFTTPALFLSRSLISCSSKGATLTITNSKFYNMTIVSNQGIINMIGCSASISNSQFTNVASNNSVLSVLGGSLSMSHLTFNSISLNPSRSTIACTVSNMNFTDNSFSQQYGIASCSGCHSSGDIASSLPSSCGGPTPSPSPSSSPSASPSSSPSASPSASASASPSKSASPSVSPSKSASPSPSLSPSPPPSDSSLLIGIAIAGGVLGLLIVVIAGVAFVCYRQRQNYNTIA